MKYHALFLMTSFFLIGCQTEEKNHENSIELKPIGKSLSLFGEGVISTSLYERDLAISADGNELIYTLGNHRQTRRCLVGTKKVDGNWKEPEVLNISGEYQDIEPFFSLNNQRLYFASNRPIFGDSLRNDYNIWYSERKNQSWAPPIPLDSNINTKGNEFFPSLSRNGNLYFTATKSDGFGKEDIFVSKNQNGNFLDPTVLSEAINTETYEFNSFISPNEDFIIFSSFGRTDDLGGGDLYISEKDKDGNWKPSRNLGNEINSPQLDYCPFVDEQLKNFYFTSERLQTQKGRIEDISDFRKVANAPGNGLGDIYSISFESLDVGN